MRRVKSWLAVLMLVSLVGTSCGEEDTPALLESESMSDISQSCWTDAQREIHDDEGDESMRQQYTDVPDMAIDPQGQYSATLETNKGTIDVELFPGDAPQTVNNFVCLARDGYFDGTPFHRIVKGFVIQGGDPTGTGSGGPGYTFADEPITREYEKGTLAMANAGPNTNGSQFFIVLEDLRGKLPRTTRSSAK